jgi:hypothetical protein
MAKFMLFISFITTSCNNANCNWTGGEIIDFGEYCNEDFKIKVYEKNHYLQYVLLNKDNGLIIQEDMNISVFQRWGLFLDKKGNLWVFSSDVGDCIWKKDSATGRYRKTTFSHQLSKGEIPPELYESSLKRYLKE